ncbi:MAG: methyltransferase [bacterium]
MGWLAASALLSVSGVVLLGWAALVLGWRRWLDLDDTPQDPALPGLVLYGPFRHVRHPQSLGLLCLVAAAALRWGSALWVLAPLSAAVVCWQAQRDDQRLAARFGEAYARYRRVVPFMLPRPW